jgi:hypothetical protein
MEYSNILQMGCPHRAVASSQSLVVPFVKGASELQTAAKEAPPMPFGSHRLYGGPLQMSASALKANMFAANDLEVLTHGNAGEKWPAAGNLASKAASDHK